MLAGQVAFFGYEPMVGLADGSQDIVNSLVLRLETRRDCCEYLDGDESG